MIDKKFERLTVIKKIGSRNKRIFWECKCSCGNVIEATTSDLRGKRKRSCGCLRRDVAIKNITSDNVKQGVIDKYGVDNVSLVPEIREKANETLKIKYGGIGLSSKDIRSKIESTNKRKYGHKNASSSDSIKQKRRDTNIKKYGVSSPLILWNEDRRKEVYAQLQLDKDCTPMFTLEEFTGRESGPYRFKCNSCSTEFFYNIWNDQIAKCPECNIWAGTSRMEKDIQSFIESIYDQEILSNHRQLISPYEVDMYLPDINLAIEFNGIYWHGEQNGKDRRYHLNKTEMCNGEGVDLVHIFENEWVYKTDIVKSILRAKLNKIQTIVYARKCEIRTVDTKTTRKFLDRNHIQGYSPCSYSVGLYYEDELVSLMTFGKSRYDQNFEWEMLRFCSELDTIVVGSGSRLFSHFRRTKNPRSVVTYADRRYFSGHSYKIMGFEYEGSTKPNYFYFNHPSIELESRIKYQKHKLSNILENFDPSRTEYENMLNNGFDRIWDCGNEKYCWQN